MGPYLLPSGLRAIGAIVLVVVGLRISGCLGGLTLAIGLSIQGALGNIASSMMIMLLRPCKLGDYIEAAGVAGTVKDISLFQTIRAKPDNIKVIVPNSQAIDDVIKNYSGRDRARQPHPERA